VAGQPLFVPGSHHGMKATRQYKGVIFDLDGTLLNTLDDIADAMNTALKWCRQPQHPVEAYRLFVGDGISTMVRRALPPSASDEKTVKKCRKEFFKRYKDNWKRKTRPYEGIISMVKALQKTGLFLAVLSNKPHRETGEAVSYYFGSQLFAACVGHGIFPKKPDPESVSYILATIGIGPRECLYVGDTDTDMKTAAAAGIDAIGVSWGFREGSELVANGAKWIVHPPQEIVHIATGV
jgi:phosphoglycolate phosphatase